VPRARRARRAAGGRDALPVAGAPGALHAAAAKDDYPDPNDLTFRGRARHVAGFDFEHSAYVMLIDREGEQRVGFPFEQLDPALLAQDIRLLRRDS
jgi:hypothetical protein